MKKKTSLILLATAILSTGFVATSCGGDKSGGSSSSLSNANSPTIAKTSYSFDKKNPANVEVGCDLKGKILLDVKEGDVSLSAGIYSYANDVITVLGSFLATLENGDHTFTIVTEGGSASFVIAIASSVLVPGNPTVSNGTFNIYEPSDLVLTLDLNNGEFTSLKFGSKSLKEDVDFAIGEGTITIYKETPRCT